jgi:hypothetical protein
LDASKDI